MTMRGEISYDLVMDDDMAFVEGTYRLPGDDWQIVIVPAIARDVPAPHVEHQQWENGTSGVVVHLPRSERINATTIERALAETFDVAEWVHVRGPDSMSLR